MNSKLFLMVFAVIAALALQQRLGLVHYNGRTSISAKYDRCNMTADNMTAEI